MNAVNLVSTKTLRKDHLVKLAEHNLICSQHNFIQIQPVSIKQNQYSEGASNWIITSKNTWVILSETHSVETLQSKRFFCVGENTNQSILDFGCTVMLNEPYAKNLADKIIAQYKYESFQFFSGDKRLNDLPNLLTQNKISWSEHCIYHTVLTPIKMNHKCDGILFFSPSGVKSYFEENTNQKEVYFCIGKTTAKALEKYSNRIVVANKPTIDSLIDSIINYYS